MKYGQLFVETEMTITFDCIEGGPTSITMSVAVKRTEYFEIFKTQMTKDERVAVWLEFDIAFVRIW